MAKIALDAGHGLYTAGKQTPDGIKEWTLNDKVRDKVVKILSNYEVEIIHTDNNEGATDETLSYRVSKYLNAGVDAFVSIHHNAYTSKWNNATGVEVYADNNATSKDLKLANLIYKKMVKYTGLKGRGVKKLNFAVINQNKIPAVLCEGGFMDGTSDYKYITSDAGQEAYAKAVAEGLVEFLGLKKKSKKETATGSTSANKVTATIAAGAKLSLKNVALYASSTAKTKSSSKTGTYYIWSTEVVNGRIRITNKTSNVGKSGQVTGWIAYTDAKNSVGSTTTTSTAVTFKTGVKLELKSVALYASSSTKTRANTVTGTYYVWSDSKVNSRVRITNSKSNVGKTGQVTGWISYTTAKNSMKG